MLQVPRPRAPTSPSEPDPVTLGLLARWQEQTLRGNLALESGSYGPTRRHHEEALTVADELLELALQGNRDAARCALLLFGSSCNNIATLARQQRDVETEGIYLYRAVERFIGVAKSEGAPLRFRSRCLLHLKIASDTLYRYFEGRGMWDAAASYSERANAAMFDVRRIELNRKRGQLTRSSGRRWLPDARGLAPQIRIDVVGSSARDVATRNAALDEHDDVLRILEPASADPDVADH